MNQNLQKRSAFTLIEMLVVASIIALLAALIFPVFARVRESGRRVSCLNNLRQLGMGFQQYTQDNRRYPGPGNYYNGTGFAGDLGSWDDTGVSDATGNWVSGPPGSNLADPTAPFDYVAGRQATVEKGAIFPYVKEAKVYYCPSNKDGDKKHLSYSMNCALSFLGATRVRVPADIVLLVDEEYANDGYFFASYDDKTGTKTGLSTATGSTDALTTKHNGGGNLLFADGHVKFFDFTAFPLDMTPAGLDDKWRDTGVPRFHDPAFGPYGSNLLAGKTVDTCNAKQRS